MAMDLGLSQICGSRSVFKDLDLSILDPTNLGRIWIPRKKYGSGSGSYGEDLDPTRRFVFYSLNILIFN